jgi:hypothetical protein
MEVVVALVLGWFLVSWLHKKFGEPAKQEAARQKEAERRRRHDSAEIARSAARPFSLYEDARTESGRFDAGHVSFSSSRLASKPPAIVTGLTFEEDRLYVLRGKGMTIFPFVPLLTVAVLNVPAAGFQEPVDFSMSISSEGGEEPARFPLSFPGWLEVIDRARRCGAAVEMDDELPDQLKELIAQPLPGDEHIAPVRIRPPSPASPGGLVRCPSCGANLGGRQGCDFCGSRH